MARRFVDALITHSPERDVVIGLARKFSSIVQDKQAERLDMAREICCDRTCQWVDV